MIIGDTNNPNGMDGTILMGPRDDTHVVNSNTAASPIFEDAQTWASITAHSTAIPANAIIVNSEIAASPALEETAASAVDAGSHDDTRIMDSGTTASPTLKRKRKYSPTKAGQRRRRWYNDGRDLNDTTRTPNSGGAQAGGDGGSGV